MLNQTELISAVKHGRIEWSVHALRRMLERGISRKSIQHIICQGAIIESNPDDQPFPECIIIWDMEKPTITFSCGL